ncbi:hypothetical protein [Gordonia sihwensis]|uniref:hypothetical protein n=1 Tax=Gordonia sihwensis TaxID=173559 RepID=UPI003D96F3BA
MSTPTTTAPSLDDPADFGPSKTADPFRTGDSTTTTPNIEHPIGSGYDGPSWLNPEMIAATIGGTGAVAYMSRGRIPYLGGSPDDVREFRALADDVVSKARPFSASTAKESGLKAGLGDGLRQSAPWSNAAGREVMSGGTEALSRAIISDSLRGLTTSVAHAPAVLPTLGESIGSKVVSDWADQTRLLTPGPEAVQQIRLSDVPTPISRLHPDGTSTITDHHKVPASGVDDLMGKTEFADDALRQIPLDDHMKSINKALENGLTDHLKTLSPAQQQQVLDAVAEHPKQAAKELTESLTSGMREGMEKSFRSAGHTAAEAADMSKRLMAHVAPNLKVGRTAMNKAVTKAAERAVPTKSAVRSGAERAATKAGTAGRSAGKHIADLPLSGRIRESTAGKLGKHLVVNPSKAAGRFLKPNAGSLFRTARTPASRAALKEGAKVGARLGVVNAARMGAMTIPVAGWIVGGVISAAFWVFDPEERGMWKTLVENMKSGWWGGTNTPDVDAAPWFPETDWLPLCDDGNRDPQIRTADALMKTTLAEAFGVPSTADVADGLWKLDSFPKFQVGGPEGIDKTSADFQRLSKKIVGEIDDIVSELTQIKTLSRGEPVIDEVYKAGLDAAVKNLGALSESIIPSLTNLHASAAIEMSNVWGKLCEQNANARETIAKSNQGMSWNPFTMFGLFAANELHGDLGDASRDFAAAQQNLDKYFSETRKLTDGFTLGIQTAEQGVEQVKADDTEDAPKSQTPSYSPSTFTPSTTTPSTTTPSTTTPTDSPKKKTDLADTIKDILAEPATKNAVNTAADTGSDLAKQLGQMLNPNNPMSGMNGMNNPFNTNPFNNPFNQQRSPWNQQNPLQQNPLAQQQKPKSETKPATELAGAKPRMSDTGTKTPDVAKGEEKKADDKAAKPAAPTVKPAAPPKIDDAKTDGSKADADKTDADKTDGGNNTVKVGDHDVRMPSTKHADMIKNLMADDNGQHPTVREAAQRAGFDLPPENKDIGERVPSPAKLHPGDLVIGDKQQGVYTGDGRVYTSDGKEIPLSKITMSGAHQGLFHLPGGDDGPAPSDNDGDKGGKGDGGDKGGNPPPKDTPPRTSGVTTTSEPSASTTTSSSGKRPPAAL